jgi:hypothetical protein
VAISNLRKRASDLVWPDQMSVVLLQMHAQAERIELNLLAVGKFAYPMRRLIIERLQKLNFKPSPLQLFDF